MRNILIIDDDKLICNALSKVVQRMGHESVCAYTLKEGLRQLASNSFDVAFLDVRLPDGSGLDNLARIKETVSSPEIIIITGAGDPDGAELAISGGAWDYIEKSSSLKSITLSLSRVLKYIEQRKAPKPAVALNREGIQGDSKELRACLDTLAQAAQSAVNVLITGETGTGKELFARAIHLNSSRSKQDFVVLDCAALPETLVESILFGHQKGAFTGAHMPQEGLLKQADGGTLFLDEVGELPVSIQKTFLRVLQEHSFRPLGAEKEIKSDFRLVAATNRNLSEMVVKKGFRKDLLYRLQTIIIDLPPLRDRPEDIREIASYHISKGCKFLGINTKGFSEDFFQVLSSYHWPGNVRELVNTMEWVLTKAQDEPILFPKHLPTKIRIPAARKRVAKQHEPVRDATGTAAPEHVPPRMRDFLDRMREQYLKELTRAANGNVKRACEMSGMSRARLYQLLKKFNITI